MKTFRKKRMAKGLTFLLVLLIVSAGCSSSTEPSSQPSTEPSTEAPAGSTDHAQTPNKELTNEEIAMLKGENREQILMEGAKKEGKLNWYTTIIVDQAVRPLAEAFEKKYPFIKVEYYRADSEGVAQKVINEYQGRRYEVDIVDGTNAGSAMKMANISMPFYSPYLEDFPEELRKDETYAISHLYYYALGYNTNLVSKDEVPKTYEDLLDPKWKGKMAFKPNGNSGAGGLIGTILLNNGQEKGMEYLEKLSQQDITVLDMSARAVLDRVIAGEYPIGLQIFNHHAVISSNSGAPVAWQPLEPALSSGSAVTVLKNAPNPHSAMLFMDFILSEEGQNILKEADYIPANSKVTAKYPELKPEEGGYESFYLDQTIEVTQGPEWARIFEELFLN